MHFESPRRLGFVPRHQNGETRMNVVMNRVRAFLKSEDGPTATEYAVMLALIIVACITAITALGGSVSAMFTGLSDTLGVIPTG